VILSKKANLNVYKAKLKDWVPILYTFKDKNYWTLCKRRWLCWMQFLKIIQNKRVKLLACIYKLGWKR